MEQIEILNEIIYRHYKRFECGGVSLSYNTFIKDKLSELKKQYPDKCHRECFQLATAMWKEYNIRKNV